MYREDADITFHDWFAEKLEKAHKEKVAQEEANEAALAVPINENSNSNNGPQDYEPNFHDFMRLMARYSFLPIEVYHPPFHHVILDDLDGHWRK
jgi:hypothetical protein